MVLPALALPTPTQRRLVLGALILLAVGVLALDIAMQFGNGVWALYLPLCFIAAWLGGPRDAIAIGVICTVLIWAGLATTGFDWLALIDQIFATIAVWLTVGMAAAMVRSAVLQKRLTGIIDTAEDAIISVDAEQRVVNFNRGAEKIFGYAAQDVIGRPLRLLLPGSASATHEFHVREFGASPVQSRRMAERGSVAGRRKDGSEFPADVSISKFATPDGLLFTAILRDATERKQIEQVLESRVAERTSALREEIERREEAQAALVRSQKLQAVGELAGGLAHDVNNHLTVITGNLELLGLGISDEKLRDYLRRANDATTMAARLTRRLLAFGRRQRLQAVSVDLSEIAQRMTDVLKRTLGEHIELVSTFPPDLWRASADVSEVENAILNLAINARDAMPGGGKLFIETANRSLGEYDVAGESGLTPGNYVMLSITDTGSGMTPEVLGRAFEPFFTTKEPGRGTGLGLSTVYGFAKQSGGHMTIYSEEAKGTSVRLYLPRAGATEADRTAVIGARPAEASNFEIVLIVEDNAEVREVAVKRLDLLGYTTLTAETGSEAISILQRGDKIDLVFSDVVMPGGMSGFDLAAWLRAHRPDVSILLTSGFTGGAAKNGEIDAPDVRVLQKPYALADLAQAVRETLGVR